MVFAATVAEWLDTVHPGYGRQMAQAVHEFGIDDAEMLVQELDIADISALLDHISSHPRCITTPLQRSRLGRALVAASHASHASRGQETHLEPPTVRVSVGHAAAPVMHATQEQDILPIITVAFVTKVPVAGRILDVSGAINLALTVTEGGKVLVSITAEDARHASASAAAASSSSLSSSSSPPSSSTTDPISVPSESLPTALPSSLPPSPGNTTKHARYPEPFTAAAAAAAFAAAEQRQPMPLHFVGGEPTAAEHSRAADHFLPASLMPEPAYASVTSAYPSTVSLFATPLAPPLADADLLLVRQHRTAAAAAAASASVYRSAAAAAAKDTAARAAQATAVAAAAAAVVGEAAGAASPKTQRAAILPLSPTRVQSEGDGGVAKPTWKERLNSIADLFVRKERVPWWEQPLQQRRQPVRLSWREELVDFAPLPDAVDSSSLPEGDTLGLELSFLFSPMGNAGSLADALVLPSSPTAELFKPIAPPGSGGSGRVSAPPGSGRRENERPYADCNEANDVATAATFTNIGSATLFGTNVAADGRVEGSKESSGTEAARRTTAKKVVEDGQVQLHSDSAEMARGWAFSSQLHATSHAATSVSPPPTMGAVKMVLSSASSPSRSKGSCSGFGFMCPACKHPNAGIWDFGAQRPGICRTCSANDAASGRIDIDIGKRAAVITSASSSAEIAVAASAVDAAAVAAFASADSLRSRLRKESDAESVKDVVGENTKEVQGLYSTGSSAQSKHVSIDFASVGDLDYRFQNTAERPLEEYTPMGAESIVQSRRFTEETGKSTLNPPMEPLVSPKFAGMNPNWWSSSFVASKSVDGADGNDASGPTNNTDAETDTAADGEPVVRQLF
eukprot:gene2967-26855_t